jgi:predicted ATPase
MKIRHSNLKNWMNFQKLETGEIRDRMFIIGPNASGKSNLLDALRFLRDVALPAGRKPSGGGLQKAVRDRGGLPKLRCVNARQDNVVWLEVKLEGADGAKWVYRLGFKGEGKANNRFIVTEECVEKNGVSLLVRPDKQDNEDPDRLTQTWLELTTSNANSILFAIKCFVPA